MPSKRFSRDQGEWSLSLLTHETNQRTPNRHAVMRVMPCRSEQGVVYMDRRCELENETESHEDEKEEPVVLLTDIIVHSEENEIVEVF